MKKTTVTLTLPVNVSVHEGAKQAEKVTTVHGNISETVWLAQSYRAMVQDPDRTVFMQRFSQKLTKSGSGQTLSDDEYLELIAVYVQSLRYENWIRIRQNSRVI